MRKTVRLRKRIRCPKRVIYIVGSTEGYLASIDRDHWRFGPETINPWPAGDYYVGDAYQEPAYYNYNNYVNDGGSVEYQLYEPHLLVDIGL